MNERWSWIIRYAVVVVAALALGAAFGEMALFKTTRLGKTGLTAANLVQFLTYGLALALLWFAARRAAALLPADDVRWNVLKSTLVPLTTLIAVSAGQAVLLILAGPLMRKVRIAVAGVGMIGLRHVEETQKSPTVELSAIVDPGPKAPDIAKKEGVPLYQSLGELFAKDKPDGVVLATPNHMARAAASAASTSTR